MFKGLGNLGALVRQAQAIPGKLQEVNAELKKQRATAAVGGGMVEVEVNGLGEVLKVRIDPGLIEGGDREMIEDLLPAAFNQAAAKAKQLHAEAMRTLTDEMNVPGLDDALTRLAGGDNDSP